MRSGRLNFATVKSFVHYKYEWPNLYIWLPELEHNFLADLTLILLLYPISYGIAPAINQLHPGD